MGDDAALTRGLLGWRAKDDDMGNAVNLQTRQVRKTMNELHQDNLVCE